MKHPEDNHSNTSEYDDLRRKHSRRAKAASWFAGIVPISGGAAIAEGIVAHAADAKNARPVAANINREPQTGKEVTTQTNNGFKSRAQAVVRLYKNGPKGKVQLWTGTEGVGDTKRPVTAYTIVRQHNGLYDWLNVSFSKINGQVDESFIMVFDANQKVKGNPNAFRPAKLSKIEAGSCSLSPALGGEMCSAVTGYPDGKNNVTFSVRADQNFGQKTLQGGPMTVSLGEASNALNGFISDMDSFIHQLKRSF